VNVGPAVVQLRQGTTASGLGQTVDAKQAIFIKNTNSKKKFEKLSYLS